MPVQTSYAAIHTKGYEGQRADFGLFNDFSKVCETVLGVNYGRALVRGTADEQAKLPTALGQQFVGIAEYTSAGQADGSDVHLYERYRTMNVIDYGPMYVWTETAVVPGDDVYFRAVTGSETTIGRFRDDEDITAGLPTCQKIEGATFESTATAGSIALIWLRGNSVIQNLVNEITAIAGAISLLTKVSLFDTTLGASTSTLADGYEGQVKELHMIVDGGDQVVTPANLFGGTTLTFTQVGDYVRLLFVDGAWHATSIIGVQGLDISAIFLLPTSETIVGVAGALSLVTTTSLFNTTAGAAAYTLADGQIGQVKILEMTVDGGDMVVTPANLAGGTTLTFTKVGDKAILIFLGTSWEVISFYGVQGLTVDVVEIITPSLETITLNGATAISLITNISVFDTTTGAQTGTLAAGEEGQKKILKMTVDGGTDMVVTPAAFFDGTTMTFADVNDSCELIFFNAAWHIISNNGVVIG